VVTGQASYKEPFTLSGDSVLTVVAVQVSSGEVVVVGKTEILKPGQVPISFSVTLDPNLLDTTKNTTLWASLVDGTAAWTSDGGVPVATNGAPSEGVAVPLTFRPDLIEGEVTGAITNLPSDVSLSAWAMAVVLDKDGESVLGLISGPIYGSTFVGFEVPFLVADVDRGATYVAVGAVFDDTRTFHSPGGVPVITNGNPYSGIELPMIAAGPTATPTPSATPSAAPTAAASATPVATASPTSSSGSGTGLDPIVLAGLLGLVIVGVIVVIVVMRR
jgi:hypothetical protein